MITLDENKKYNWSIKYTVLDVETSQIDTLISGNIFDFIPNKEDIIKIDGINYKVVMRIQDFDNETIWISLYKIENQ